MNAPAKIRESSTQKEFLKHANFEPVFDAMGNIVDIRELKISTDRRAGMEAMRELFATSETGDDITMADGFTMKQRRILDAPAPLAAHYLRYSQKYDAKTGMMRDGVLIQLPLEVVWTMFELLFKGQYSVKIGTTVYEDEEVMPVGNDHKGNVADDAPGRRFYANATVTLKIRLPGGLEPMEYDGFGVAYGQLTTDKTGNIYKINSERRTVEKGAIADAKREALANMGPVFRRAFEDGDKMIEHMQHLLLEKIQEQNKPAILQRSRAAVPAPVRRAAVPAPARKTDAQGPAEVKPDAPQESSQTASQAAPAQQEQKPVSREHQAASRDHEPEQHQELVTHDPQPEDPIPALGTDEGTSRAPAAEETAVPGPREPVDITIPGNPDRRVPREGFEESLIDIIFETCSDLPSAKALLESNAALVEELAPASALIEEALTSFDDPEADGVPDFEEEEEIDPSQAELISVEGKSGRAVLAEMKAAIDKMKTPAEIDAFIARNPEALRKMTATQSIKLWDHSKARRSALAG